MPRQARSTHEIEVDGSQVVKRFRSWDRGEPQREWRALTLLAEFAPGLAPAPVSEDIDSDPPTIRMARLPGEPLAGQVITARHLDGIAAALHRLHTCLPADVLASVPPVPWLVEGMANRMRSLASGSRPPHDDPEARVAFEAAKCWLDQTAEPAGQPVPVFGQSDGNLDNFLWDGEGVRIVDFEDSGRSERAFELAALVEHVSVWHEAGIEATLLLDRFDLTAAQSARVLFFRRAFAIFWLYLVHRQPDHAGVPHRQASRLLALLAG
ncbi:MAG: phosphotransferase family protein [Streptosporangiaceae bacterium]